MLTKNTNSKYIERAQSHIKPNSCIDPTITKSLFEGFLHRYNTVSSEKYIKEETVFSRHVCREWT